MFFAHWAPAGLRGLRGCASAFWGDIMIFGHARRARCALRRAYSQQSASAGTAPADYTHIASPVHGITLRGRKLYVKRDDLLSQKYPGNKLRKLQSTIQSSVRRPIVSFGGNQSNAMLAIAALAHDCGVPFTYHTQTLPKWLKSNPIGNLAGALELGMQIREHAPGQLEAAAAEARAACGEDALFLKRGGAFPGAEAGLADLAGEIEQWRREMGFESLSVVCPAGTGSTALYVARNSGPRVRVVAVPCVGDEGYLRSQWRALVGDGGGKLPEVLEVFREGGGAYAFGKPYPELLEIFAEARDAGILFDLLYAPKALLGLLGGYEDLSAGGEAAVLPPSPSPTSPPNPHPPHAYPYPLLLLPRPSPAPPPLSSPPGLTGAGRSLGNESMLGRYRRELGLAPPP
eukprot:tig00020904_g15255.t1